MSRAPDIERRAVAELRRAGRRLEGRVANFGTEARVGDFTETIAPGAFGASLGAGKDILALVDHDPTRLLARTKSGTLRLSEDAKGLAFSLDLPETQAGKDVLALAERDDLGGMSFGFTVPRGGERWTGRWRELTRIELREISVVSAWPAYPDTSVAASARDRGRPRLGRARRFLETVT